MNSLKTITEITRVNELTIAFQKSLFEIGSDLLPDLAEIGLDQAIEEGVLREIPVVKTMYAVCKVGHHVRERNLLKQTMHMIDGFRSYCCTAGHTYRKIHIL